MIKDKVSRFKHLFLKTSIQHSKQEGYCRKMSVDKPVIVSDATPLIGLAKLQLDLLTKLFGRIIIPPAVFTEVTDRGDERPGAVAVRQANWLEVQMVGACRDFQRVSVRWRNLMG